MSSPRIRSFPPLVWLTQFVSVCDVPTVAMSNVWGICGVCVEEVKIAVVVLCHHEMDSIVGSTIVSVHASADSSHHCGCSTSSSQDHDFSLELACSKSFCGARMYSKGKCHANRGLYPGNTQ